MFWILLHVSLLVPAVQMLVLNGSTEVWTRSNLSLPTANTTRGDELTDQYQLNRTTTAAPQTGNMTLNGTFDPRTSTKQTSTKQTSQFKESLWARVLVSAVVVLVLMASGGLCCYFRHNFIKGCSESIEANSGQLFVLLPCKSNVRLPSDARVEWTDRHGNKVHVYQILCSEPEKQIQFYRNRTEMSADPLQTGDLSLTLRIPTGADTDTYTCCVYSHRKRILMKTQVQLQVKVQQVEVGSGADKVLLPCHTSAELFKSCKVEWKDSENQIVHVFQDGSDHLENQDRFYRNRTELNKDWTQTGDLTLTLKHLTYEDSNIYICSIFSQEGNILYKKQVQLKVEDCQVEVEEGAESVQLPFKVAPDLLRGARIVWWRYDPKPVVIVHVFRYLSDQLQEQDHHYRTRTKMNEDLLQTGDISLTLIRPAANAEESYRCGVWRKTKLVAWTTVLLKFKGGAHVQDEGPIIRDRSNSIDMTPLMSAESNDSLLDALR
ncbi:uncharacterized protein LOC122827078 [Gambusia affinis]|uniref:uncharacterized protein LOC122827078 n=1 Tax=Gambusia affinis TaxID=33528 RepID=UPI001CDB6DD9|nr:uncharacterized protein LOC122827078 [Gambusia affinis]XP_043965595.1 uncharacterized protein LOC122827078 [Gambusia affinis]XP_043965596.1 uncharacterized protein LOC122827078 [Gambusia affinis]XP_043965597.1 uncharacterized protein LOC122827078 [Gambusia affinis]XP_043965598.1 uncharacterized protein LOC122827078 [Gambusia affinis]